MKRKGFPESYDRARLVRFLNDVKSGVREVDAPVYGDAVKLKARRPILPAAAYGFAIQRNRLPPMKSVMRFGASRKSSALRVGGVSIHDPIEAGRGLVQVGESFHRHVALRADELFAHARDRSGSP